MGMTLVAGSMRWPRDLGMSWPASMTSPSRSANLGFHEIHAFGGQGVAQDLLLREVGAPTIGREPGFDAGAARQAEAAQADSPAQGDEHAGFAAVGIPLQDAAGGHVAFAPTHLAGEGDGAFGDEVLEPVFGFVDV